ncbi:MAG TPA: hypothetical protein VKA44_05435, partial [Gemmatimonadota bacterium]|nr:hypothetical protein [Gemmatimonadota bacterium]
MHELRPPTRRSLARAIRGLPSLLVLLLALAAAAVPGRAQEKAAGKPGADEPLPTIEKKTEGMEHMP